MLIFVPPSSRVVVALIIGEVTLVPTVIAELNDGAPALAIKTVFAPPCAVACIAEVVFP